MNQGTKNITISCTLYDLNNWSYSDYKVLKTFKVLQLHYCMITGFRPHTHTHNEFFFFATKHVGCGSILYIMFRMFHIAMKAWTQWHYLLVRLNVAIQCSSHASQQYWTCRCADSVGKHYKCNFLTNVSIFSVHCLLSWTQYSSLMENVKKNQIMFYRLTDLQKKQCNP